MIAIKNSGTTYCKNLNTRKYEHITLGSEVLLIQCKNLKVEKPLSKTEQDNLKALAKQTGATPLHVFNRNHKLIIEEVE